VGLAVGFGWFEDRDFNAGVRPTFPAANMLDPVNRKLRLLRAWDFLLQARSKHNMERISTLIQQLESESENGW